MGAAYLLASVVRRQTSAVGFYILDSFNLPVKLSFLAKL